MVQQPDAPWRNFAENVPIWPEEPFEERFMWSGTHDRYMEPQGHRPLRQAIADREKSFGGSVDVSAILITNGGFDALALSLRRLRSQGSRRVVCIGIVLQSVASLALSEGYSCIVLPWDTLNDAVTLSDSGLGATDVIYLNSPHNPTGRSVEQAAFYSLLKHRRDIGFSLVLDLVYDSFSAKSQVSLLSFIDCWVDIYVINSFSKNYGAPGIRVGWLIADPAEIALLTAKMEIERICVGSQAQIVAQRLCAQGNRALVERVRQGFQYAKKWASANSFAFDCEEGGTQVWLNLGISDIEPFADFLAVSEHLVLTTGANYYPVQLDRVRLPIGVAADSLSDCLDTILSARIAFRERISRKSYVS